MKGEKKTKEKFGDDLPKFCSLMPEEITDCWKDILCKCEKWYLNGHVHS